MNILDLLIRNAELQYKMAQVQSQDVEKQQNSPESSNVVPITKSPLVLPSPEPKKVEGDENFIFVYGTLKYGHGNARFLSTSTFIGGGTIKGFVMLHLGGCPGIVPHADPKWTIEGEVYRVTDSVLSNIDKLEGHPNFYERTLVDVEGVFSEKVWTYVLKQDQLYVGRAYIPTGRWMGHRQPHQSWASNSTPILGNVSVIHTPSRAVVVHHNTRPDALVPQKVTAPKAEPAKIGPGWEEAADFGEIVNGE
jgi:gamma-glutamylaminecyclotransferase